MDGVADALDEFGQIEWFLEVAAQASFKHPIRHRFLEPVNRTTFTSGSRHRRFSKIHSPDISGSK